MPERVSHLGISHMHLRQATISLWLGLRVDMGQINLKQLRTEGRYSESIEEATQIADPEEVRLLLEYGL